MVECSTWPTSRRLQTLTTSSENFFSTALMMRYNCRIHPSVSMVTCISHRRERGDTSSSFTSKPGLITECLTSQALSLASCRFSTIFTSASQPHHHLSLSLVCVCLLGCKSETDNGGRGKKLWTNCSPLLRRHWANWHLHCHRHPHLPDQLPGYVVCLCHVTVM